MSFLFALYIFLSINSWKKSSLPLSKQSIRYKKICCTKAVKYNFFVQKTDTINCVLMSNIIILCGWICGMWQNTSNTSFSLGLVPELIQNRSHFHWQGAEPLRHQHVTRIACYLLRMKSIDLFCRPLLNWHTVFNCCGNVFSLPELWWLLKMAPFKL